MSANIFEQALERICAKCGQRQGDLYSLYYGKYVSSTSTRYMNTTVHKTKYDVAGEKSAALCNECIRRHRTIRLVVFGVMTAVGAGLALWAASMNTFADPTRIREAVQLQMFTLGIAGILGLVGLWKLLANLLTSKNTHAENMIIALKKFELRQQGFSNFWNHKDFNKMRRG